MADEKRSFPVEIIYCGVCGLPPEYCEYGPEYDKCKGWLQDNEPDLFDDIVAVAEKLGGVEIKEKEGKRQTRGGRGAKAVKKKTAVKKISISKEQRSKKKSVTIVSGLATFDIDLKKAAKLFANRFSCGSSVTGDDEIVIQGDVADDLIDLIQSTWSEIDDDSIDDKT